MTTIQRPSLTLPPPLEERDGGGSHCNRGKNYDIKLEGGFMFNIGFPELLIIVAIALIVFGPNKLPELAKAFGRAMREFKKATEEVKESFEAETKGLDELKNTFAEEREKFLAGLTEEVSETTEETPISSETTGERMGESEAPALAEVPASEAASSHRQEEKIEKKEKEEPEEAKEGIPSHG